MRTLHGIKHTAWLCVGYFNETLYGSEHFSCSARPERQMRAFREVVVHCSFNDLGWSRFPFTWTMEKKVISNVKARLDSALANPEFLQRFEHTHVRHLSSIESDHCFVVLQIHEHL
jgi:hypothetical protein